MRTKRLRRLATALGLRALLKALMRTLGFDLVKHHFYSPIPDVEALPEAFWVRRSKLGGLVIDADAQLRFLEEHLAGHISEWSPPRRPTTTDGGFYLDNLTYGPVDAEILYGLIRHARPRRVIEVGSGFSSLVIGEALAANRAEGSLAVHEIVDPTPASSAPAMGGAAALRRIADLEEISVTEVPLARFASLAAGDVLFVDATHTVKIGGDVNRIVLDVLPLLQPGVLVQFHDIFLPWEYPRRWIEQAERYWAEQYLLQAFLAFNDAFEVVVAAHLLAREFGPRLARVIPGAEGASPLAFWIRRIR